MMSQVRRTLAYASRKRARSPVGVASVAPADDQTIPPWTARMTDFLRETIDYLAKARGVVQRQRALIARLKSNDLPTRSAEQTLQVFLVLLAIFEQRERKLLGELSARARPRALSEK